MISVNGKNKKKSIIGIFMLIGVLLLTSFQSLTQASSSTSDDEKIAQYILYKLSYSDKNYLSYLWGPVSKGDKILATKEHIFDVPCPGYVLYIDLYPMANMFHSVQYVFLAESSRELSVFDASSSPLNFNDYHIVKTPFSQFFFSIENRRASIPDKQMPSHKTSKGDSRWAVLMNGGYDSGNNHIRYWDDLSNIYITLNSVYQFPDENIIVLCSDGTNPAPDQSNGQNSNPDLDGDGDDDIMYSCVLSNVDMVFASLAANFTASDKLFVFTTDHGNTMGGWNVVENLWNHEELTDAHFAELLAAFPQGCEILCTFEPCFSGGFLDNVVVAPGPVVASSACAYNEYSYAMSDLVYDEYVFYWTAAMKGEDAYGHPVDADANQDGYITMDEAYSYAKAHDTANEHPQYGSYPEGAGANLSLWESNKAPNTPLEPNGTTEGVTGREYSFSTSATDPEGEDVYYQFDWGDGNLSKWYGPYGSGVSGSGSFSYAIDGVYNIRARAKDINDRVSGWSTPHAITIYALPTLEIRAFTGRIGHAKITIKNSGKVNVTLCNWSISIENGLILLGKQTSGSFQNLNVGQTTIIESNLVFGYGKPTITVNLETQEQVFEKSKTVNLVLFFILFNT
jgi:hypothetical protein